MRSCSMALQLLTSCLGSYSAGVIVWVTQAITQRPDGTGGWLPRDINKGRLDLYFVLLAVVMAVNTLLYLVVACKYEYKEVEHEYNATAITATTTRQRQQSDEAPEGGQQRPPGPVVQPQERASSQSIAIQGVGMRMGKGLQNNNTSEGPY